MRNTTRSVLCMAFAAIPSLLAAQAVTVQSKSDVRFYGALGAVAGLAERFGGGGSMHDIASTTYLSGHKMRLESASTATIIDADAGRITTLDHKAKTYTSMTFAEMAEAMQKAASSSAAQNSGAGQNARAKDTDPKGDVKLSYKVSVDEPGESATIAGYKGNRTFVTISIEGEAKPEGGQAEQVGTLVLLMDTWLSKDAPQIQAMQEFQRAYAEKAGRAFQPPMDAMKAAFASDARIKVAFEASAKELEKVQGIALRSTTYITLVPPSMAFDRGLALNDVASADKTTAAAPPEEKKSSGGFRGLVGKLKSAADEANKKSTSDDKAPPKQTTLMTVKQDVSNIAVGAVSPDLFAPPAGYREITRR